MDNLKLKDYAIIATDEVTGEAFCRKLTEFEVMLFQGIIADNSKKLSFQKVHGFELRAKK
jgi:hypothetical protein